MNRPITSTPTPYSPTPQSASRSSSDVASPRPAVANAGALSSESPAASPAASPADQSTVAQHADYTFSQEAVQFPEAPEAKELTYAGLGEIMGGIAALFSGAPSASFSPVIEQAQKNLAERRSPQPPPVEVDTAASDKKLRD